MAQKTKSSGQPESCEYLEQYPAANCKAFHDGLLIPNQKDMQEHCLHHPKDCSHYPKEERHEQ